MPVKDSLQEYDFEGRGSPTGSLGCCSLLESDNDLQFLNDLGPKFRTLAEICSPVPLGPRLSTRVQTVRSKVVSSKPVVQSKFETKHTGIKTEKMVSTTNISKSSASTVSATLPQSKVTNITRSSSINQSSSINHSSNINLSSNINRSSNITHSSNIRRSATLPPQAQTVIVQQQPIYYATAPMLQPMQYVVQPQLQSPVLYTDGTGMYYVESPRSPTSPGSPLGGMYVVESPRSPGSPGSPGSPTMLLPVGPGTPQGPVPGDGWKIIGPQPDGNYILVKEKSGPGEPDGVSPGAPQGTLPRGAVLVKEAAPPQGVLGPAAPGGVLGTLPEHTDTEKGDVVPTDTMTPESITEPQPVSPPPADADIKPEVTRSPSPLKEDVSEKNPPEDDSKPDPDTPDDKGEENQPEPVINDTSEKDTKPEDEDENAPVDSEGKQAVGEPTPEKPLEQPDSVDELLVEKTVPEQPAEASEDVPNETSETTESNNQPERAEVDAEVPSPEQKDDLVDSDVSPTEALPTVSDDTDAIPPSDVKENEEGSVPPQEETATSTPDLRDTAEEVEEEVSKALPLTGDDGSEDINPEVGSEPQPNEAKEDQSGNAPEEESTAVKEETDQTIDTSDTNCEEENTEGGTVTSDDHKEDDSVQEQPSDAEVVLSHVGDELAANLQSEIPPDTANESEAKSISEEDVVPEASVNDSVENKVDVGIVNTDVSNQGDGDLVNPDVVSESAAEADPEQNLQETAKESVPGDNGGDNQPDVTSGSEVDKGQLSADAESGSNGDNGDTAGQGGVSASNSEEDFERQDAVSTCSQMEEKFISDDNITDGEELDDVVEEVVAAVQEVSLQEEQGEERAGGEPHTSSQVDDTLIPEVIDVQEKKEESVEAEVDASQTQPNISDTDNQGQEVAEDAVPESIMDDQLVADTVEKVGDTIEEVASEVQSNINGDAEIGQEDTGSVIPQAEDQIVLEEKVEESLEEEALAVSPVTANSGESASDEDTKASEELSPQLEVSTPAKDEESEKEECTVETTLPETTSAQDLQDVEEVGTEICQVIGEESQALASAVLSDEDPHLASQNQEVDQDAATTNVSETQETPDDTTLQVEPCEDSAQIEETIHAVIDDVQDGADLEDVTSPEEESSSRVATGQVSISREDLEADGSVLSPGQQEIEGESGEVISDQQIAAALEDTETISDLEVTEAVSPATEEVAESGNRVGNESVEVSGEAAGVSPNTAEEHSSKEAVSEASAKAPEAAAGASQTSPAQPEAAVSQGKQSKSKKSKKDSKSPKSPKSPSPKCKQQ